MRKLQVNRYGSDIFNGNDFNNDFEKEEKSYVEPKEWTIINALDRVLEEARDSELSDEF